jgi:hypothetical protein
MLVKKNSYISLSNLFFVLFYWLKTTFNNFHAELFFYISIVLCKLSFQKAANGTVKVSRDGETSFSSLIMPQTIDVQRKVPDSKPQGKGA